MARNNTPLTEKVLVSTNTKHALMSIREPGERYGDVIERVLQDGSARISLRIWIRSQRKENSSRLMTIPSMLH